MNNLNRFLLVFYLICLCPSIFFSQNKSYTTRTFETTPPKIDGLITEPSWETVEWVHDFTQRIPRDGASPTQKTAFKIIYDDKHIYIAIRAYDTEPEKISQRATRRDGALDADMLGIFFDSYFDKRTSFEFYVTAAGVKHDRVDENSNWDPIWYLSTKIDSLGWVAEISIPLSQLRYSNEKSGIWGLQVGRFLHRKQEWSYWKHIPQNSPDWVSYYGELHGMEKINVRHQVELKPYIVADYQTFKKEIENPFRQGQSNEFNGGLDGKIGITSNLTLDLTVNPDFGQVEADPSEVNLSAFETRFEEKRNFFIEGQNILNYNLPGSSSMDNTNLFYSRRIGRRPQYSPELNSNEFMKFPEQTSILGAAKLTGRTNKGFSIGVLNAVTATENAEIAVNQTDREMITVEPLTNYFVGRLQKEYNEGATIIGGTFTSTNRNLNEDHLKFLNKAAYTGGLNFIHQWIDRTYYATLYTAMSHITGSAEAISLAQLSSSRYFQRPDAPHLSYDPNRTSMSGHAGSFSIGKGGNGHWLYNLRINWRSPGLELNDIGFLQRADLIQEKIWLGYNSLNPVGIFRNLSFATEQLVLWNFNGDYLYSEAYLQAEGQFNNYYGFWMRAYFNGNGLSTTELRGGPALKFESGHNFRYRLYTDSRKKLQFNIESEHFWLHDNYTQYHLVATGCNYRPFDVLSLSITPSYNVIKENLQWVNAINYQNNSEYIFARMEYNQVRLTLQLDYNITPNLTIQYYGQPFIAAGKYSNFKKITNPRADKYEDRFREYRTTEILRDENQNIYQFDDDQNGSYDYEIENPDFNIKQFRSNLVVRWEYIPGSTIYLVWSQDRHGSASLGNFDISDNTQELFDIQPHNIFLIKVSHNFSL